MLQQNITHIELADLTAERQTNYLILRTLESKLETHTFRNLINSVGDKMDLPRHLAWDGHELPSSYNELKASQRVSDEHLLTSLVRSYSQKNFANFDEIQTKTLTQFIKNQTDSELHGHQNIYSQLQRKLSKPNYNSHKVGTQQNFQKFERLKTVFCHADLATDEVSAIYNVHFDQKGTFIVSGADEGIIKVWDRQTLTLQASLHGHFDYITEIDISKCNKYIASAGKDAQIIIWELATGKLVNKLTHHSKLINCIKFFQPTPKKISDPSVKQEAQQQYLFSCSDDGTVRLYDFTPISGWSQKPSQDNLSASLTPAARSSEEEALRVRMTRRPQRVSVSTSNATEQVADDVSQLYSIELTPDEFRPGTRNKKLDTLVINHQGLVVAGSSSGELLVWRVNYDNVNKRVPKQDCYKFLGQFKMSRQSCVKFCEFSPKNGIPSIGETLMTGSVDGQINLWNMSVGSWRSAKEKSFNLEDKSRLIVTIDETRGCRRCREVQISEPDGLQQSEYILEDVPSEGNQARQNVQFSKPVCYAVRWSANGRFAIASVQCQIENKAGQLEICRLKVWDTVQQTFIEDMSKLSGVSLPKNTFVLATHPTQEEILMTGSDNGFIALWNLHSKQLIKQFIQYGVYSVDASIMDNPLHGSWSRDGRAFIVGNCLGTISLYGHESESHRYQATRVQQFFQYDIQRQTDNPFEKITSKPTICGYNMMPYEVQPERYLIRFTDIDSSIDSAQFQRNLNLAKELGMMEERYYQDQLQSSMTFINDINNVNQILESFQVSAIQPILNDEDQDMSDIQLMQSLENQPPLQQQQNPDRRPNRPRLQRNNQRRSSSVEIVDISDEESADSKSELSEQADLSSDSDSELSQDSSDGRGPRRRNVTQQTAQHAGRNGRPLRAARPANLRDTETIGDENSSESVPTRNNRGGRRVEFSDDESPDSLVRNGTTRRRQNGGQAHQEQRRLRQNNQVEEIQDTDQSRQVGKKKRLEGEDYVPEMELKRGAFDLSDFEFEPEPNDKTDFSSHMLIAASKFQNAKMETNLDLVKDSIQSSTKSKCALCQRNDGEIVGPFCKRSSSVSTDLPIYLHKDCIEINTYSYFNINLKKWVNIESMLKQLMQDAQYQCFRCDGYGATVSCITCGKNFHGYYCAGIYLLPQRLELKSNERTNNQSWQCFFCLDQQNYENAIQLEMQGTPKDQKVYLSQLKKLDKSHLILDTNHQTREQSLQKTITYNPQIDDVVLYFYQGHEDYIYQYNCHFYAGQSACFPRRQLMPWFSPIIKYQIKNQEIVLCKVLSVTTLFPSKRSLKLITEYGQNSSECVQIPQMIQRIELQLIDQNDKFYVDLFPNELPDFLVLYQQFQEQQVKFKRQNLIGKEVTVRLKSKTQKVKIIEESPVEKEFSPKSLWQTIVCIPASSVDANHRGRQQQTQSDQVMRVNFWDIVFDTANPTYDLHGFSEHEHTKLKQYLTNLIVKKTDYLVYFKERVQEKIAPEYRQFIPQEMWFDLLLARLQNKYYRSNRQFFADLQLIAQNAASYNGKDHDVTIDAMEIVKKVRIETMKCIDCNGDRQIRDRVLDASKLTAQFKAVKSQNGFENRRLQQSINIDLLEESKDEDTVQRLGGKRKRVTRHIEDSPDFEMMEDEKINSRNLRKRQRQL